MATKTQIQNRFELFCKVYNLRHVQEIVLNSQQTVYKNTFLKLDYWQGYRIVKINPDTSESYFDGAGRKTANEMLAYLNGLLDAKDESKYNNIQLPEETTASTVEFWVSMFRPRDDKYKRQTLKRLKSKVSQFETPEENANKIKALNLLLNK